MALEWSIEAHAKLVIVNGAGDFDLSFMGEYLAAMRAAGANGYRKFFDLRKAVIRFTADDFRILGSQLAKSNVDAADAPGPIAILIGPKPPPLLVDMAVLLKQHVGASRVLRIFTRESEAAAWLNSVHASSLV